MYQQLQNNLTGIIKDKQQHLLAGGNIGLEKESLRVDRGGEISQNPHPARLGSALTNPYITTDYSEALLEFITPPLQGVSATLEFLKKIHQFVYTQLEDDELLWDASMPCVVAGEASIPIAQYGNSNLGMMKTVYRRGLGYRYGKMMQVIAGVHFNYSVHDSFWPYYREFLNQGAPLQDFTSDQYFGLIRNLQRYGWLIYYLFGASPAICKSFLKGHPGSLEKFDDTTYYLPYATTLRMGDVGYTNKKESESGVKACYDSIDHYVRCLTQAIEKPCSEYEKIGVKVSGEYRQLNANILQIENEYYSTVRPKQPLVNNEKPSHALSQRGVQYIELRSLDLNLFDPLGISATQLYFLEAFMIFCLLQESPIIDAAERQAVDGNENKAAHQGRDPAIRLARAGTEISIQEWGAELLHAMQPICIMLDEQKNTHGYSAALQQQVAAIDNSSLTPSARMLDEMHANKEGFFEFSSRYSKMHQNQLCNSVLSNDDVKYFTHAVRQSVKKQRQIEVSDTISFDQFLDDYFSRTLSKRTEVA